MKTTLVQTLNEKLTLGAERCGLVLADGRVVELRNIHPSPEEFFEFDAEEFGEHLPHATATWHTHPTGPANLSVEDYHLFLSLPRLWHYIVAPGYVVRGYYVQNNVVLLYDDTGLVPEPVGAGANHPGGEHPEASTCAVE